MNRPTPAIVSQASARQLPRWALLLVCAAYLLPGQFGGDAWRHADLAAFFSFKEASARDDEDNKLLFITGASLSRRRASASRDERTPSNSHPPIVHVGRPPTAPLDVSMR